MPSSGHRHPASPPSCPTFRTAGRTRRTSRVLTIDLHAGQVQGFFNIPVDELTAMQPLLRDYVIGMEMIDPVVVAADLGFAKRARNFADLIGASVAFVVKRLPNLTVLSVSLLLGEAISRIHTGESVGALFGAPV